MKNTTLLDVGTGTGIFAIYAASKGATVVATDQSYEAARATLANAKLNNVNVDVIVCDLFSSLRKRFDSITFNAPFVSSRGTSSPSYIQNRPIGNKRLDTVTRFLLGVSRHLKRKGICYLVVSSFEPMSFFRAVAKRASLRWKVSSSYRNPRSNETVCVIEITRRYKTSN